jgi:hypothetical protein
MCQCANVLMICSLRRGGANSSMRIAEIGMGLRVNVPPPWRSDNLPMRVPTLRDASLLMGSCWLFASEDLFCYRFIVIRCGFLFCCKHFNYFALAKQIIGTLAHSRMPRLRPENISFIFSFFSL